MTTEEIMNRFDEKFLTGGVSLPIGSERSEVMRVYEVKAFIREALEAQEKEFKNSKEYRELEEKAWKYDQLNK